MFRSVRRFVNITVWTIVSVYFLIVVLLRIPAVKTYIGERAAEALSEKIGTEVTVGKVDLGMMNRAIVDGVVVRDEYGKKMLSAGRLSVKLLLSDLVQGKITIASAQVFSLRADLYIPKGGEQANYLFLVNAFKDDGRKKKTNPNLKVNSLIIRRSAIAWNDWNREEKGTISPSHFSVGDVSAHIILNKLSSDSVNLNVRRLSLNEKTGLEVRRLSFRLTAGRGGARMEDFRLQLPQSEINAAASASYRLVGDEAPRFENLEFSASVTDSRILPSELHLIPGAEDRGGIPVEVSASVSGTESAVRLERLELSQAGAFALSAGGAAFRNDGGKWSWNARINRLDTSRDGIENILSALGKKAELPAFVRALDRVGLVADASSSGDVLTLRTRVDTNLGGVVLEAEKSGGKIKGTLSPDSLDLAAITGNADLGRATLTAGFEGETAERKLVSASIRSDVESFRFRGHDYRNLLLGIDYDEGRELSLSFSMKDECGNVRADVACAGFTADCLSREMLAPDRIKLPSVNCRVSVRDLRPGALNLTGFWGESSFCFNLEGNFSLDGIDRAGGVLRLDSLEKTGPDGVYRLSGLSVEAGNHPDGRFVTLSGDFATASLEGDFRYETLGESLRAALAAQLPALGVKAGTAGAGNRFGFFATVSSGDFFRHILGLPLEISEPAHFIARVDDERHSLSVNADAGRFSYDGRKYADAYLSVSTPGDTLRIRAGFLSADAEGNTLSLGISSRASANRILSSAEFDSRARNRITGEINANVDLGGKTEDGKMIARVDFLPSDILIAGTTWTVNPSTVLYHENFLRVDGFGVSHGGQYINIGGQARKNSSDEILVTLKDVNVAYILDFIDFHAVDFDGEASGRIRVERLFDSPALYGNFEVTDFRFEEGAMGTLRLDMDYGFEEGSINIDAAAVEDEWRETLIRGYVSPKRGEINLNVRALGSSLDFVGKYCDDFAEVSGARGWGEINVTGPLGGIFLTGQAVATADFRVLSTGVGYHLEKQRINFNPDDIEFPSDTLTDRDGHRGILTGRLPHRHLSGISYNLAVSAENLLAMELDDFGEDAYYGTVYATGTCTIDEVPGGTLINVDITPEDGSFIMYNATAPERVSDSFVRWRDKNAHRRTDGETGDADEDDGRDMLSDLNINFLIRCDKRSELRILMDERTGDVITLNGGGVISASFYNKGTFELYGNYVIDSGTYRMTIQDVIKRDFTFKQGGTISFGGDALHSQINMQANYTLNSVPLSDINIGKSFSNNNVRVDCIMNITGTPDNPQVEFSLDMPTIGSDAKQMIMSMFNDTEEMNQQVVYLIAVGRFLNQDNSSNSGRYSQTSLAMQSIISGTVSQQINTLLENVIGSKQWDFGANISTGEEGFNDAEYEGLVSGRMFNSRLIFNGQFGYRDNPNATSSFIGDFDLRYLLVPTGSLAVRIYNETNNRYFTKNTLTTQGVSLIVKKDFAGWRDFFRRSGKNRISTAEVPSDTISAGAL